jgi:PST family polysaccharide transporter
MTAAFGPEEDDPFDVGFTKESLAKRSLQGTLITAPVQVSKIIFQLISQMALARLLFPKDYGLLAMASPLLGFVQLITDVGLGQEIIRRTNLVHAQVSSLFWVNVALSCCLAVLFAATSPIVAIIFREPDLVVLMASLSLLIPLSALGIHPFAILSRQMRFGLIAKYDLISNVTGITFTVVCAWFGCGYWSLVVGQATTLAVYDILGWLRCGWRPMRPAFHKDAWTDLKSGSNLLGANLAGFLTSTADNWIVGVSTGSVALGLYDRSYRLVVQPIGQLSAPVSRIAVPLLSRLSDSPHQYRKVYIHILKALMLLTVPLMLVCISSGLTVVEFLLGGRWLAAAPVFSWICVGGLMSSTYSSTYWLFISQGRSPELMRISILSLVINVATFLVGAYWGLVGIASAGAIGFVLVTTPLMLYTATRIGPVGMRDILRFLIPAALFAAATYGILVYLDFTLHFGGFLKLVALTSVSYGAFAGLILLTEGRSYIVDLRHVLKIARS